MHFHVLHDVLQYLADAIRPPVNCLLNPLCITNGIMFASDQSQAYHRMINRTRSRLCYLKHGFHTPISALHPKSQWLSLAFFRP